MILDRIIAAFISYVYLIGSSQECNRGICWGLSEERRKLWGHRVQARSSDGVKRITKSKKPELNIFIFYLRIL